MFLLLILVHLAENHQIYLIFLGYIIDVIPSPFYLYDAFTVNPYTQVSHNLSLYMLFSEI